MLMTVKLASINLEVADPQSSKRFYLEGLGMTENTKRSHGDGFVYLESAGADITIAKPEAGGKAEPSPTMEMGFETSDLADTRTRLERIATSTVESKSMGWGEVIEERKRIFAVSGPGSAPTSRVLSLARDLRLAGRGLLPRQRRVFRSRFSRPRQRSPRRREPRTESTAVPDYAALRRSTVLRQYGGPRGGERSGTHVGSPMPARKRAMLSGFLTSAMSFIRPLHLGHSRTSTAKVRASSSAHGRYVAARFGFAGSAATSSLDAVAAGLGRPMRDRHALADASTPAYFTV